ncbi:cobalamin biosynthesis protein [Methylovulum psychrotolerans]|uniref:Cobalamin biosynthesis protein CbiG n=1 Tax=Methylovulum psychrotolerans TaxID=1704499 RepID=A0A1Z4BZD6_9GAMM|nr:cobalamin biosynthesis protein [Methylovulum psychrotolerans]ASF46622.1 cobalamin biosynthesis protein CbiG [Methylovulum psychrotolerans]
MNGELGIWLVRPASEALAERLRQQLGGVLYRPWQQSGQPQQALFAQAYRQHRQWLMLAASGIAVRFLDGLSHDKHSDPAVVVIDEAGRFAVSLLAGHEGGANRLAYRAANVLGAVPVITTATEALKPLVVGIGCRKDVGVAQISAAVQQALGLRAIIEIRELVTIDLKAQEQGLLEFCQHYDLPLRVLASETVAAREWLTQPSEWVQQNIGLAGVCEPCALIASPRGRLIVPKTALAGVAVAIVEDTLA